MNNECIANWLKNIKEKYLHGDGESLDDTRKLAIDMAIERLNKQQETIEDLKYERFKAIENIELYLADAEADAKTPSRIGKGYYVGLMQGLLMAKEIIEGKRNHG